MKKLKHVAILLFIAAVLLSPLAWWFWPHLKFEYAMMALSRFDESRTVHTKTIVTVNTFRDEVSSEFIKARYDRAAKLLKDTSTETKAYRSTDSDSWDHVITVLSTGTGYAYVSAGSGNDSETLSIGHVAGKFDNSKMELLTDWKIPHGLLRCDWSKNAEQDAAGNPLPDM